MTTAPLAGTQYIAGLGVSTVRPSMDFETYSEAGMYYGYAAGQFKRYVSNKKGISIAGAWAYSCHPSTEVICLAYDLKDGHGERLWIPGQPNPSDLFDHFARGGIISAFNSMFEYCIWRNVCAARLGWPELPLEQLRDTQAKGCAFSLPAGLDEAAKAVRASVPKNPEGKSLIQLFSVPRKPTKGDSSLRRRVTDDVTHKDEPIAAHAARFYKYCIDDIRAEDSIAALVPDLSPDELELWLLDQRINVRGCAVDREALDAFNALIPQFEEKYNAELAHITGGAVKTAKQSKALAEFVTANGYPCDSVAKDNVEAALDDPALTGVARQALQIRQRLAQSSVAKIPTIIYGLTGDNRARGMFMYYGAHTGRFAGRGPQPQNMPAGSPPVWACPKCSFVYGRPDVRCCEATEDLPPTDWSPHAVECVITLAKRRDLALLELYYPDSFAAISGCLRGLFMAAEGHDLIDSDYSAIEAVVLACLAGEQWRIDVFNSHGKIYEMSAAKVTGVPFEEFQRHKDETGEHHPLRKKVGKVAELACFGADTLVYTRMGGRTELLEIRDVTTEHELHDGVSWVQHDGVVSKGVRETIDMHGLSVTPDHKIWAGGSEWRTADHVAKNPDTVRKCLKAGFGVPVLNFGHRATAPTGAMEVFDVLNCGPNNRFAVLTNKGILIAHNSGYQGGIGAWKQFGADKFMSEPEIKENIKKWRAESPAIVNLWYGLERAAINAVKSPGATFECRKLRYYSDGKALYCILPSGRAITYHEPIISQKLMPWGKYKDSLSYMGWKDNKWRRIDTYGGRLAENCFAGNTLILTDTGFKVLKDLKNSDRVFDGSEFVNHGGLICQGKKKVGTLYGTRVTGNHKILAGNSWKSLASAGGDFLHGALRLGRSSALSQLCSEVLETILTRFAGVTAESLLQKILDPYSGAELMGAKSARILQVEKVAELFPLFLDQLNSARPGVTGSREWFAAAIIRTVRSLKITVREGLRSTLRGEEISMRSLNSQRPLTTGTSSVSTWIESTITEIMSRETSDLCPGRLILTIAETLLTLNSRGSSTATKTSEESTHLSGLLTLLDTICQKENPSPKLWSSTEESTEVFDIRNCGPRNQFMVFTDGGQVIAHNCTQAVARDIFTFAMVNLERAGYPIVLHTHDQITCEVRKGFGSIEAFEKIMSQRPAWCADWPIRAAGGWRGKRYRKD